MRRGPAALGLVLAALPPAYACFVAGWQLVSFTGFAVRLDEDLPGEAWRDTGLAALQMAVIAAALLIVWQGATQGRWRRALIALAIAWIAGAPLFVTIVRGV